MREVIQVSIYIS